MNRILLIIILLSAFFLRVTTLDKHGLYIDEKFTALTSNGITSGGGSQAVIFQQEYFTPQDFWAPKTMDDYFEAVARGEIGAHIVFNFVLKAWTSVFGMSDFSLRMPSVLFGCLTVLLVFLFVKDRFKNEKLALLSAAVLAIEPLHIALSIQARSYSLSILLTFVGTYLFFKILDSVKKPWLLTVLYALVFAAAILNHYLNGVVFMGHALYLLFYHRDFKKWFLVGVAGVFASFCLFLWLTKGGGQYSFKFMADKNELLGELVKQNPIRDVIEYPSAAVLVKYMLKIFLDTFQTTNSLYRTFAGFSSANKIASSLAALLIVLANLVLLKKLFTPKIKWEGMVLMFLFIILFPQIFLIIDALRNGHTGNITQRYFAFALPYISILMAMFLGQISKLQKQTKLLVFLTLGIQAFVIGKIIVDIHLDKAPKYTTRYGEPRGKNPYKIAADKIKALYAKGDVIIYPSYGDKTFSSVLGRSKGMVVNDAQNTNVYLPKDATYLQRIDTEEPNKIILQKSSGQKIEIFDFQDDKYRY